MPEHERKAVKKYFTKPSRTKQSFKDETNINKIMGKWRQTGNIPNTTLQRPVYGDFTNAEDYMTSLNQVKEAQEIFDSLPHRVRRACDNDPAKLIALVEDPENEEMLRELGLKNPIEEREPAPPAEPESETPAAPPEPTE